jgi:hypothetical protein
VECIVVDFLECFRFIIISSINGNNFTSSYSVLMSLISFAYVIALASLACTMTVSTLVLFLCFSGRVYSDSKLSRMLAFI